MTSRIVDPDFARTIEGYGLTTAEIIYRLPDQPSLVQTYLWQQYDIAPHFPILHRFLSFWQQKLDGTLHSVRILGTRQLVKPIEFGIIHSSQTFVIH